jgi:hypothetical protein
MPKTHLLVAFAVLLVGPASAIAGSAEYQSLDAMGLASGKEDPMQDQRGV